MEFDTRQNMMKALVPSNAIMAELGVFQGTFSTFLYNELHPKKLYLVDLWEGNILSGDHDGNNLVRVDAAATYLDVKAMFCDKPNVVIIKDWTSKFLNAVPPNYLDVVYLDADHSYNGVMSDLQLSYPKVKTGGWIMGHDYGLNMQKCKYNHEFGVKRAVDDFLVQHPELKVDALAYDGCISFAIRKL